MKLNLCILSLIFTIIIFAINPTANAQSDNFKTYTNNDLGFTIQHPSKWKANDDLGSLGDGVYFRSSGSPTREFAVTVEKVEPYLDTDTMTLKNTSLQQYAQKKLDDDRKNSAMLGLPYTFIRQNEVTVGGNPGWKIEYTMDNYDFDIFTVANGKLYQLSYDEEPLKVPETLPLANRMVESFQVNTEDEDTGNNSTFEDKSNNLTSEEYQNKYCPPMSLVLCRSPPEPEEPQDVPPRPQD
jgi:hypothetical protein